MKKIYATKSNIRLVQSHCSLRRFIRKVFANSLKYEALHFQDGFRKEVMQKLQDIEEMIAREIGRKRTRGK